MLKMALLTRCHCFDVYPHGLRVDNRWSRCCNGAHGNNHRVDHFRMKTHPAQEQRNPVTQTLDLTRSRRHRDTRHGRSAGALYIRAGAALCARRPSEQTRAQGHRIRHRVWEPNFSRQNRNRKLGPSGSRITTKTRPFASHTLRLFYIQPNVVLLSRAHPIRAFHQGVAKKTAKYSAKCCCFPIIFKSAKKFSLRYPTFG